MTVSLVFIAAKHKKKPSRGQDEIFGSGLYCNQGPSGWPGTPIRLRQGLRRDKSAAFCEKTRLE
jgi:hypothetical protein